MNCKNYVNHAKEILLNESHNLLLYKDCIVSYMDAVLLLISCRTYIYLISVILSVPAKLSLIYIKLCTAI